MIEFQGRVLSTSPFSVDVPKGYGPALQSLALKHGVVTVRVSEVRKRRTTGERSQSHHLNGHVQTIAMETGNDFEAVKSVVKLRAIAMGYPFKTYRGITVPKSEADCTTKECALLIDAVHQLAAEEGIVLVEYDDD